MGSLQGMGISAFQMLHLRIRKNFHASLQIFDHKFNDRFISCLTLRTRPNTPVLSEFNLTITKNKTIAIVGPSGCGKSTVASLIQRIYDCQTGEVMLNGIHVKDLDVRQYRQMIGVVSQEPSLFASTISENIAIGVPNATKEMIEKAAYMANCDFINSLPKKFDTDLGDMGDQLSGGELYYYNGEFSAKLPVEHQPTRLLLLGQKQRIAIARVFLQRPKILILDEATSALDLQSQKSVQDALNSLIVERKQQTIIIIAHRLETIENADEIICMLNGEIVERASHQVLMESDGMYKKFVEKSKLKPRNICETERDDISTPSSKVIHISKNDESSDDSDDIVHVTNHDKDLKGSTTEVIAFKNVSFSYPCRPEFKILDGLSLSINKGELLALVGKSGGGKSTVATLMMDLYRPQKGKITYNDNDCKCLLSSTERSEFRKKIGYINQEPYLFDDTIANNISFGVEGASFEQIRSAATLAQAHDFITSLPNGYNNRVGENGSLLSGGQKQRIAIARALIRKPKVLIVDEATSALDPLLSQDIQETIENICHDNKDIAVVIITHKLDSIQNASKIALISHGKVLEYGTHEELMGQPESHYREFYGGKNIHNKITDKKSSNGGSKAIHKKETVTNEEISTKCSIFPILKDNLSWGYILLGSIGALIAGFTTTLNGMLCGLSMDILFEPILPCNDDLVETSCEQHWQGYAEEMVRESLDLVWYLSARLIALLVGYIFLFIGFGKASEQMKKRLRVKAFRCLCEKELAFHDKHSVSAHVKMLEEDMRKIDDVFDQPLRICMVTIGSVLSGMVICYYYMWPLALLLTLIFPLMIFSVISNKAYGEDEGANGQTLSSSDAIAMETVMKKNTISSFCLEERQYQRYAIVVHSNSINSSMRRAALEAFGFSFRHCFSIAFQFFVGGLLLARYPQFAFRDFAITMLSFVYMFMALDISGITCDRKEARLAVQRIAKYL